MNLRALLFATVALAVPAVAAPANAAQWVGFNDISSVGGLVPFATAAKDAANAGATSARMIIDWSWLERENDVLSWGMVDGAYWADLAKGMRPLIGITGAPRWAWDASATCRSGTTCAYPPGRSHDADFQDIVRRLVRRYPQAAAIEVGNEPNLAWAWAGGVDPARYTELLKLAYTAVKSVNPAMPVISGGLAPVLTDAVTSDFMGLRPFLQAMYDNGAKGYMDGISIHPYPYAVNFAKSFAALSITKDIRSANGDDVPLWVTEFGLTASVFTPYEQAITVPALYRALTADPEIQAVYVHTLYDDAAMIPVESREYGMVREDGTPKPAYCGLALANRASWTCPAPITATTPTALQSKRWEAQVLLQAAADAARRVHLQKGTFKGTTAADLAAYDPRISTTPATGAELPGLLANPARIGVYTLADDALVLCNTSAADRSYCIATSWGRSPTYGSALGTIFAAAGAVLKGTSATW